VHQVAHYPELHQDAGQQNIKKIEKSLIETFQMNQFTTLSTAKADLF
jgi:hypothetical protein